MFFSRTFLVVTVGSISCLLESHNWGSQQLVLPCQPLEERLPLCIHSQGWAEEVSAPRPSWGQGQSRPQVPGCGLGTARVHRPFPSASSPPPPPTRSLSPSHSQAGSQIFLLNSSFASANFLFGEECHRQSTSISNNFFYLPPSATPT